MGIQFEGLDEGFNLVIVSFEVLSKKGLDVIEQGGGVAVWRRRNVTGVMTSLEFYLIYFVCEEGQKSFTVHGGGFSLLLVE